MHCLSRKEELTHCLSRKEELTHCWYEGWEAYALLTIGWEAYALLTIGWEAICTPVYPPWYIPPGYTSHSRVHPVHHHQQGSACTSQCPGWCEKKRPWALTGDSPWVRGLSALPSLFPVIPGIPLRAELLRSSWC